jgi:serine/threonine-protein kinase
VLVLAAVAVAVYATRKPVRTASVGTLIVSSAPEGAEATIDGVARGTTPLQLTLPPGAHLLELKVGTRHVSVPLSVDAGVKASQHIEFAPAETPPRTGALEVISTPPGDEVRVDGQRKGKTPLKMSDLALGTHTVVVGQGAAAVTRTVSVAAGTTASVVTARREPADPVDAGGWVAFKTPIDLKIYENGRLIGVSGMDRLALSTGSHTIDVANEALEFRTSVRVTVTAGKLATVNVPVPNGSVSLNATPWAEVTIDGRAIGTTPVANVPVPIGRHELVWRHPQHGERRQEFTVTASSPLRLAVDLTK